MAILKSAKLIFNAMADFEFVDLWIHHSGNAELFHRALNYVCKIRNEALDDKIEYGT